MDSTLCVLFGHFAMSCLYFLKFFVDKCKTYPGSCCLSCIYWRCSIAHTVRMHRFTRLETVLLQWHCIKITRNDLVFESIGFWICRIPNYDGLSSERGLCFCINSSNSKIYERGDLSRKLCIIFWLQPVIKYVSAYPALLAVSYTRRDAVLKWLGFKCGSCQRWD